MANLYELSSEMQGWLDLALSEDPDEAELASASIPMLKDEIAFKAEQYAKAIKCLTADVKAFKDEEDRLAKKRKAAEATCTWLKGALAQAMTTAGIDKLPTSIGKWSISTCPASVEIFDEASIPDTYKEAQAPKILRSEILKAYKLSGEIPAGCSIITDKKTINFR